MDFKIYIDWFIDTINICVVGFGLIYSSRMLFKLEEIKDKNISIDKIIDDINALESLVLKKWDLKSDDSYELIIAKIKHLTDQTKLLSDTYKTSPYPSVELTKFRRYATLDLEIVESIGQDQRKCRALRFLRESQALKQHNCFKKSWKK